MKHAIVLFASVAAAFVIGCQSNDEILSPAREQAPSAPLFSKAPVKRQAEIRGFVTIPGQFNAMLEVNGSAEYSITLLERDPMPPNPQYSLQLAMNLRADLSDYETRGKIGAIAGTSNDDLPYTDGNSLTVTQRYAISGTNSGLILNITFNLTRDDVRVAAMRLERPNQKDQN